MTSTTFKKEYGSLSDSVVIEVFFAYSNQTTQKNAVVQIECRNIAVGYQWQIINIHCKNITEFKLHEGVTTSHVISDATIKDVDGFVVLDFGSNDEWETIEELRTSPFYIICKDFWVEVL